MREADASCVPRLSRLRCVLGSDTHDLVYVYRCIPLHQLVFPGFRKCHRWTFHRERPFPERLLGRCGNEKSSLSEGFNLFQTRQMKHSTSIPVKPQRDERRRHKKSNDFHCRDLHRSHGGQASFWYEKRAEKAPNSKSLQRNSTLHVERYVIWGAKWNFAVPKSQNIPALLVPQMEHVRSVDSFVLQPP